MVIPHDSRCEKKPMVQLRLRAFDAVVEMRPNGITQTMLAVQMVGVHTAIVEFLSRAAAPEQMMEMTDRNVARATRLMRLFNEQCEVMLEAERAILPAENRGRAR